MAEEYLYGITLSGEKKFETWDPEPKNDDNDDSNQQCGIDQKLIIKMALLGHDAKEGEINVIQVEARSLDGVTKIPIAILEMGKQSQVSMDLSFPDAPVTFTLIKGSGPVHIVGHNLLEEFVDMEDEDVEGDTFDDWEDEKDGDDDEDEDDEPKKKKNKVALPPPKNKNQVSKNQNQNANQKKK
ncbi:nucleoplasmin-like protein isoform X2 [Copidosoma floridanum]|uniref:nucleoplasmin-like protein isoform X2 n=1 Tax=Copidosoma floridanum TaxID=29053 RepID=UPI0006C98BCB|nr:nucleoplasmin-like protein isoform X2 [Copidosoma floridanum]